MSQAISQMTSQTLLVDAFYTAGINGHGGDHRTAQIAELIEKASLKTSIVEKRVLETRLKRYLVGLRSIVNPKTLQFIAANRLKIPFSPTAIAFCGFQKQIYADAMHQHLGTKLLLWETTKNYVAPYVAQEHRFKVIALPHNLDCFVLPPSQFHQNFDLEVQSLAKAEAIFCISREEQWLLKLKGLNADFLPYYPPEQIVERLLDIRSLRKRSSKKNFLILGSAGNIPTFQGMVEQIQWLKTVRNVLDFRVDIVGYRTETLQPYCDHEDFVIHGSVTAEELKDFLIHSAVALVHQTAGVGALTRIPELLIAGVPVIANSNACRSAFDYPGIYCYDTVSELADLMAQAFKMPFNIPEMLPRPVAAEKRFITCLLQMVQQPQVPEVQNAIAR
jgi:glycosyltransferase involved in cell wall biosynthesis